MNRKEVFPQKHLFFLIPDPNLPTWKPAKFPIRFYQNENVINETVGVIEKLVNKIVELKAQNAQLMETNRNLKNQNTESAGNLADILAKAQEVLKD